MRINYLRWLSPALLLLCSAGTLRAQLVTVDAPDRAIGAGVRLVGDLGLGGELSYQLRERMQVFVNGTYQSPSTNLGFGVDSNFNFPGAFPDTIIFYPNIYREVSANVGARFFNKAGMRGLFVAPSIGFIHRSKYSAEYLLASLREDLNRGVLATGTEINEARPRQRTSFVVSSEAGYRGILWKRLYYEGAFGSSAGFPSTSVGLNVEFYATISVGFMIVRPGQNAKL